MLAGGSTRTSTVDPVVGATSPAWGKFTIPGGGSVALTFVASTLPAITPGVYQNPATVSYDDPTRTASQTVSPGGTYTAGGTVGGSNYNPASSTNEDVTVLAAPTISKSFNPSAVTVGAASVMTVTINNPSSTTLTGGGLVDNYPAGMVNTAAPGGATTCGGSVTAAPGGTGFTLSGATFAAVTSCTVTVNVKLTSAGSFTNTIAAGALTDTQNVSNPASASATLFTNVTVAKSFSPNAVAPGADSTLSIVLTNPNASALTLANPGLTDSFPANLVASGGTVSVTGAGCTGFAPAAVGSNATGITLTAGTLPANASCTVSFAVHSAVTGIYSNTTSGVTTVETGTTGPASNSANLGVGLINIAKAFAPAQILATGTSVLTFTLTNPTGVAQTNGTFADTLTNMSVSGNQNTGGTCVPVTALANGQTVLSFSGINVPAAGCTITLVVTSSTVGSQTNTSGGVATALLPAGPASNTATLTVLGKPTIAKAFAPSTITPGATSTLTFTITNPGPAALSGMSFTDSYGASGLVNATPLTVGGSCTGVTTTAAAGGNTFNVTAGNIPASASCTITVAVTAASTGSYNNTSSGVATTQTGAAGTGSNTATLNVANPPTITKAFGTSPIAQGGTSLVTFTLANGNTIALTSLNFTDALTNMSVASPPTIGGTCAGTTNAPALVAGATALNLTVPTLAAGASCTVTVSVTSSVSGTWNNTTSGVSATQTPAAGAASNTASLVVLSPPSLAKNFVPGSIEAGGTSAMTFTLTNPNASALTNVTFTDALTNMSVASTTIGGTCAGTTNTPALTVGATSLNLKVPTIAAGASCTITVTVTSSVMSPAAGHPNTTSTVSSTQTAVNPGAAATGNLVVYVAPTVTKTFSPNSIASGGTSTITFTITNPNALGLTDIRITDNLPTNLSNTAAQSFIGGARGTCMGTIPNSKVAGLIDPITFTSTNLAAGASCTILMDVTSGTVGFYTNAVTNITSNQTPTPTAGGSDSLSVGRIQVTKSFSAATVQTNGTATMTFSIFNNSGANRTGLTFTDAFPAGLVAVGGAVTTGGTCTALAPTTVTANATAYNLTALNLNSGVTCTISFAVRGTTAGAKTNTVTGTAPSQFNGSTDSATITVFDAPTIAKAFAPATIPAGGTSTLTFTLTNPNGFAALSGAAFTDTLANMAVSGAQSVGGTCAGTTPSSLTNGATALSFSGITIPAGGSCTVTLVVGSSTVGVQPNTASGITTTQTPTVGANSGAVNLTVGGINLTKAFSPTTRPLGAASTATLTLTSTQAVNWTGLGFTDTLPANLVVANPANAVTTCGAGVVGATPGSGVVTLTGGTMASGGGPCTVSFDVVSAVANTYTNNAANITLPSPGLAFSGAAATVQYFNNAALTKAFAPAAIAAGGTTTLTFTLTNPAGSLAVSGLGFTDTLPTNVVVAAVPAASNTCGATFAPGAGSASVTLSGGSLGAGVASCTASVNVTSSVLGTYVNNSSNVGALTGGLTAATANASFSVVGTVLTKAFAPTTVGRNAVSTLTFTIANGTGNPAQSGLAFTDTLPASLVVASPPSVANTCGGAVTAVAGAGSIALSGGALAAAQASCTIAVNVTSAVTGVYPNTSTNISGQSATMDTSGVNATLSVLDNPTAAKAFGAAFLAPGGTTSLTLTFTNGNGAAVTGLAFTDTFPVAPGAMTLANVTTTNTCGGSLTNNAGGALAIGSAGIKLSGGSIPATGSCTVSVNITVPTAGTYTNTLAANTITTTNGGTVPTATSASLTVPSAPTIAKSFAGPSGAGRTVTLTFTLTNPNAGTALSGVAFADTFPVAPAAMVVAAAPNATTSGCGAPTFAPAGGAASIAFSAGTIAASGTCTVTVDVTVPSPGTYNNTSGTVSATGPVALTGGTASASLSVVQPALTKAFAPATVDVNVVSVLTFTLTNGAGNPAQSGINFTETLPAGVLTGSPLNISSTCPSGAGVVAALTNSTTITVTGATMSGGQAACTISVDVHGTVAGTYNNTNAANISAVQRIDTTGVNATLTVRSLPTLTKAFAASSVGLGLTTTLVFTVDNTGANAVNRAGMSFTDTLPAGISIANPPVPAATANCGAPTFTAVNASQPFTASALAVNAGQICTITLTVRGTTLGTSVNGAAQITASSGLTNGVTNQSLAVVQPSAAKTFGAASINDAAATTLVFTLTNGAGNPAQSGIALGDTLPSGLALNSATPAVGYSAGCAGPFAAAYNGGTRVLSGLTGITMTAGTASCTVTVSGLTNQATQLNASCAGNPAAFTNLAANVTTTNATNGSSDQCLVVSRVNSVLTKAFAPATIDQGGTSTLVFTLANSGSNPAQSGINFTDTFTPGGVLVAGTPSVQSNCPAGGALVPSPAFVSTGAASITVTGAAINAGVASCEIRVNVTSNVPGTYLNTNAANISGTANVTTAGLSAQLVVQALPVLTKAFGSASLGLGQTTTLAFTLDNSAGPVSRSGISFSDALPAGLEVANPPAATTSAGCVAPTLAGTADTSTTPGATTVGVNSGQTCVVTFTVRATTLGAKTNNAGSMTVSGTTNGVTPQVVTVVQASLDKAFNPVSIAVGATSTLTFTLSNGAGNPAEAGVAFTDNLPGNVRVAAAPNVQTNCPAGGAFAAPGFTVTAAAGSALVSVSGASMSAAVASCSVRVDVTSSIGGVYTNDSTNITGAARVANAVTSHTLTVTGATPTIAKAFAPSTIAANGTSTLTVTLTNANTSAASLTAALTDTLPAAW